MVTRHVLEVIFLLALPAAVFLGGALLMSEISGRSPSQAPNHTPLNQRLGYDVKTVADYWAALEEPGRHAERRFLELDLIFPFLYGAAYVCSYLVAWASLGRPFNPLWVITPVVVTLLADWTENLVQLDQIKKYQALGSRALEPHWIQVASVATVLKLTAFCGMTVLLLWLVAWVILRAVRPS